MIRFDKFKDDLWDVIYKLTNNAVDDYILTVNGKVMESRIETRLDVLEDALDEVIGKAVLEVKEWIGMEEENELI